MPRGKKIIIETEINDDFVDRFRSINLDEIKKDREHTEEGLSSSVASVFKVAQNLYRQKASEDELEGKHKLYSVRAAYDFLKDNSVFISFRAFGGRIERGTIPFVKVGRKRYIPVSVLEDITKTKTDFYTVKEAFEEYKKANQKINFRAFIGRIEKGSIPSVKFGTRRLVPRDAVESLTHISSNYYTVSQAIKELYRGGIRIKRNAFERRLDRGRIPHVKIGGRRFIHEDVMKELVDKEVALKK
ncbi:MAG: hypothetical protein ABID61_04675 [Candidatus Micrarchaeota archaeon]